MKKVVIYSGRFQPMLSHHAKVYDRLQAEFPDADVYIGTSDKVEGQKSPFSFKEKQMIAQAHGIDPNKVLMAKRPYHKDDYSKYFNEENTHIFFAVGEKDLDRFPFNNVDPETDLDMTVRGESKPKYYQKINTYKQDPMPMSKRGYITLAPTIQAGDEVASASAFRSAIQNAPDEEKAKAIYTKQFGEFDQAVFGLIYNKIKGSKMSEDINIMRKLAGLSEAPVEFDTPVVASKATFLEPNKSSSKMSIANRFPKGADVNDPEVKKEQFIQALMKSPASLISEINERLDPKEENNMMIGQKLDDIINELGRDKNVAQLEAEDKKFVLDIIKVALKDMSLVAGDDSEPEYEPEPEQDDLDNITNPMDRNESLDLDDIRADYGIEEKEIMEGKGLYRDSCKNEQECKAWADDILKASINALKIERGYDDSEPNPEYYSDVTYQEGEEHVLHISTSGRNPPESDGQLDALAVKIEPVEDFMTFGDIDEVHAVIKADGEIDYDYDSLEKQFPNAEIGDFSAIDVYFKEAIEEGGDCYHCDGKSGDCDHCDGSGYVKFADDPNEPSQDEIEKHSKKESALSEKNTGEIPNAGYVWGYPSKLFGGFVVNVEAGNEQKYINVYGKENLSFQEQNFDQQGVTVMAFNQTKPLDMKKFAEEHSAMERKMSESAPFGEPSQEDEMYDKLITAYENGEEDLAEVLGMSLEELDAEMSEYARDHNLHMDDDRDEVAQGYIEDVIHNADFKDYGSAMYDNVQEGQNCGCGQTPCKTYGKVEETADKAMQAAIQELRSLAGI